MTLTPREIVQELDKYIIKQEEAKKAVAIALINRERRRLLPPQMQKEITPKNILMVGPSGIGKTEIARRLAQLIDAPFIKVDATQFTEVGYVGKDVVSIVHEIAEHSVNRVYQRTLKEVEAQALKLASQRLIDYLYRQLSSQPIIKRKQIRSRSYLAQLLNRRKLEDTTVEIEVEEQLEAPRDYLDYWDELPPPDPARAPKCRKVSVREARRLLTQEEARKLIDFDQVVELGVKEAEEKGIIFIDELDKLCTPHLEVGRDVSGVEVQKDLLPIVEGTTIMTRYGPVKTDHMLFLAAGTFSRNKPSDLIPELQGRLPCVVELSPLSQQDLERILTEPENSLTKQYQALLATEGVELVFTQEGIREIAKIAELLNEKRENIGARRLHSVMEEVLRELSFNAAEYKGKKVIINKEYVLSHIGSLTEEELSRYIL